MSLHKTASLALFVAIVALIVGNRPAPAAQDKDTSAEFSVPPEVKELLEQRLELLRLFERSVEEMQEVGRATTVDLLAARRERLRGELDLAGSRQARVEILREQVEVARAAERIGQRRADKGAADPTEVWKLQLIRLDAEIDLARERRKLKRREF